MQGSLLCGSRGGGSCGGGSGGSGGSCLPLFTSLGESQVVPLAIAVDCSDCSWLDRPTYIPSSLRGGL